MTEQNTQVQQAPQYIQADPLPLHADGSINMLAVQMNPNHMANIGALGLMMASSKNMIPSHFQNQPSDCSALVMQAMRWGMDPYSVAQQAFIVSGTLGYSSQLVNAVVTSSNAVTGGFSYEYSDDAGWDNLAGRVEMVESEGKTGQTSKQAKSTGDRKDLEKGLWAKCGCKLAGDDHITWGQKVYLADITTRNSPLWKTAIKQQLSYLCVKYWSRLFTPQVIMGVYTKDEIPEQGFENAKHINPEPDGKPSSSMRRPDADIEAEVEIVLDNDDDNGAGDHVVEETTGNTIPPMKLDQVLTLLTDCESMEEVVEVMNKVVEQGQFSKGTEEFNSIKAKFNARKRFFSAKNNAANTKTAEKPAMVSEADQDAAIDRALAGD